MAGIYTDRRSILYVMKRSSESIKLERYSEDQLRRDDLNMPNCDDYNIFVSHTETQTTPRQTLLR